MSRHTSLTAAIGLLASLILVDTAAAYYSPSMGRFLSRDPIAEPGAVLVRQAARPAKSFIPRDPQSETAGPVRIDVVNSTAHKQLTSRDDGPAAMTVIAASVAHLPEPSLGQESKTQEQEVDDLNLYNYARSSPTMYIDPLGLSTKCGTLSMNCKCSGKKEWPVYGDSERAKFIFGGKEGCVTLLVPKAIFCTGSCQAIKGWVSAGNPSVKLLDHEACHACAFEDVWLGGYLWSWIPGDLTGHCDRHPISSTPSW